MLVWIRHREDAGRLAEFQVPISLKKSGIDFMDLLSIIEVSNGDFRRRNADDGSVFHVKSVYVVTPLASHYMIFERNVCETSVPWSWKSTEGRAQEIIDILCVLCQVSSEQRRQKALP